MDTSYAVKLRNTFDEMDLDNNQSISFEEIQKLLKMMGTSLSDEEIHSLIKEVDKDASGDISFEEFSVMMRAQVGDRESRLQLAFEVLDIDGSGSITNDELLKVMSQFGLTEDELKAMLAEVDLDGSASITFEEFVRLAPEDAGNTPPAPTASPALPDTPVPTDSADSAESTASAAEAAATTSAAEAAATTSAAEVASSTASTVKKRVSKQSAPKPGTPKPGAPKPDVLESQFSDTSSVEPQQVIGTSHLAYQTGLFRLIQGAAYRCFRESFSANHETHLRVRNLPYRITDFTRFVTVAMEFYKGLGVVDKSDYIHLDALTASIQNAYSELQDRIEDWESIEKTPGMMAEHQKMMATRQSAGSARDKFIAGIEFAISMKKGKLGLAEISEGVMARQELQRLRKLEMEQSLNGRPTDEQSGSAQDYLGVWHRVILNEATEEIDGAMMPVSYWYEEFMPALLNAFSVGAVGADADILSTDEAVLDQWFEKTKADGEFAAFGADLEAGFPALNAEEKRSMRQAWRLTRHYLNGIQKQRERAEVGREDGELSNYIAFLDVPLNRTHVRDAAMRVSFPYFLGPAVWRFLHSSAEIVCTKTEAEQEMLLESFKRFFGLFATMYSCPYCRHHLNAYVVQNREVDMYPLEYLVLGRNPNAADFEQAMDVKLTTVKNGEALRLFFWKLHNTVSSSIERSEAWYQKDEKAFYTTRFWPSLDSLLAESMAFQRRDIPKDRLEPLYALMKPMARLSGMSGELQRQLSQKDTTGVRDMAYAAGRHIQDLESAVVNGDFLQRTYGYNPDIQDPKPAYSLADELFSRSGVYTEA